MPLRRVSTCLLASVIALATSNILLAVLDSRDAESPPLLRHDQNQSSWEVQDHVCRQREFDRCPEGRVSYYNPLNEERWLCGRRLPPNRTVTLESPCLEVARIFQHPPDPSSANLPPIVIRTNDPFYRSRPTQRECDIPCFEAGRMKALNTRVIEGTDWSIAMSMEGSAYYKHLDVYAKAWTMSRFYSTTSHKSEIPLSYLDDPQSLFESVPVNYDDGLIQGALFLASNCNPKSRRQQVVRELLQQDFRVDSLGQCWHNRDPSPGMDVHNKTNLMRHYMFYLAFENQETDGTFQDSHGSCTVDLSPSDRSSDYITEKLWDALRAGVIPVYLGAPNVAEYVPVHSIVDVNEFSSTVDLAQHLRNVASNRSLYDSYHSWRSEPLPQSLLERHSFGSVSSECRTCRWAAARLYGFGWNHTSQSIQDLAMSRKACRDDSGFLVHPMREIWSRGEAREGQALAECSEESSSTIHLFHNSLTRTLSAHDGVVDLLVEVEKDDDGRRLALASTLVGGASCIKVSDGHHRLQNAVTRITLLVDPPAPMEYHDGTFVIEVDQSIRLRILIEDVDNDHEGANETENFFGARMIRDFWNPIQGRAAPPR